MGKHHAARLFLTAGAGLLTACASHAWPLVAVILTPAFLAIVIALVSTDERTPFERMVVLLCILRRIDPRPYLRLPESARRKNTDRALPPDRAPRLRRTRERRNATVLGRKMQLLPHKWHYRISVISN